MTEAQRKDEPRPDEKASTPEDLPAAGPHGKEELIDRAKTPGTGMLPEPDAEHVEGSSG